ncbi:MAG: hypothetical protein HYX60_03305 [Legionella longbeachae]|nr:hypothetical protein [Legionella longbeachae]
MLKYFFIFSIMSLVGTLSACGPMYKTEYNFIPPQSDISKMCTAQCVQAQNDCQQNCRVNTQNCIMRAQQSAFFEFNRYKEEQARRGMLINKSLRDFDKSSSCNVSCNCESTYRSCYSACGGEVQERQVCVAFCDKEQ